MNPLTIKNINKSSVFIMPLVFPDNITYRDIVTKDFVNAFISDLDDARYDGFDTLQIAYNKNRRKTIGEVERYKYNHDDKDYMIYVFDTPEEYMNDMVTFFRSRYSELSDKAKERILKFWDEKDTSELYAILYNKPELLTHFTPSAKAAEIEPHTGELYPEVDIGQEMLGWPG